MPVAPKSHWQLTTPGDVTDCRHHELAGSHGLRRDTLHSPRRSRQVVPVKPWAQVHVNPLGVVGAVEQVPPLRHGDRSQTVLDNAVSQLMPV